MGNRNRERPTDAKDALVDVFSAFGDDALRDVWLFDQDDHEAMYLREDVERKVADLDVPVFVDNERYGYITRDTYGNLYYATYEYTVRGFDEFEQFRTFLATDDVKVGVFASFDCRDGGYDFGELHESISAVVSEHSGGAFVPE